MREFSDENFADVIKDIKIKPDFVSSCDNKSYLLSLGANTITFLNIAILGKLSLIFYPISLLVGNIFTHTFGNIPVKKMDYRKKKELEEDLYIYVSKLKSYGIEVTVDDLKNAFIQIDNSSFDESKVNIYFFDVNNKLKLLQERISYQEEMNDCYIKDKTIYILNESEKDLEISSITGKDIRNLEKYITKRKNLKASKYNNMFEENIEAFSNSFLRKHFRKLLLTLVPAISLSFASLKSEYGSLENIVNTTKILKYYSNPNSLSDEELSTLLNNIEKEIRKVSDDEKFNVSNLDTKEEIDNYLLLNSIAINQEMTKEEKEIYYNFLDFFNDNPYLNKKDVYNRLSALDFIREDEIDNFSVLKLFNDTLACYLPLFNKIIYVSECDYLVKAHEATHAILGGYNMPRSLAEGLAEIITHEYFYDNHNYYNTSYCKNVAITKLAIELTSKDIILKSFGENNIEPISDKLIKNQISNGISYGEARSNTYEFLEDIDISFDDNLEIDSYNFDIFYPDNSFKTDIIEDLEEDFYNSYMPDNIYYYFNQKDEKTLTKKLDN